MSPKIVFGDKELTPKEITPEFHVDPAAPFSDKTAIVRQRGGVIVDVKVVDNMSASINRAVKAMHRFMLAAGGDAYRAGYYIQNHRGRNKLVTIQKRRPWMETE